MDTTAVLVLIASTLVGVLSLWLGAAWLSGEKWPRQARHAPTETIANSASRSSVKFARYGVPEQPLPLLQEVVKTAATVAQPATKADAQQALTQASADSMAFATTLPMDFEQDTLAPQDWPATQPANFADTAAQYAPTEPMPLRLN